MKDAKKQLQSACKSNDAKQARTALINLFKQHHQNDGVRNLQDVEEVAETEALRASIRELDAVLYRGESSKQWNSDMLLKAVESALSKPVTKQQKQVLAPLYPQ